AHAVHESAIGHSTHSRNCGRSLKGLEERIRPPREFVCRYFFDGVFHLDRSESRKLTRVSCTHPRFDRAEYSLFTRRRDKSCRDEAPPAPPCPSYRAAREHVPQHQAAQACPR